MRHYLILILITLAAVVRADDGSNLWLATLPAPQGRVGDTPQAVAKAELAAKGGVRLVLDRRVTRLGDGYNITRRGTKTVITAAAERGLLYGAYAVLGTGLPDADGDNTPAFALRMLNHWDNLDGTIERGYAGHSLWQWDELPATLSPRYAQYARACASIGINATVLNNVNASPDMLRSDYIQKVAALARVFRPYGLRVFLSVNFASPKALGGLPTADPLDKDVAQWWRDKCDEIYRAVPDFGGFLVKANSEGQPGPGDYHRTHAQGANMLAAALAPHGGTVLWRAFVYNANSPDRARQAYDEFRTLDGQFATNVILQVKNGPIDFQPREPYTPLFGQMPHTPLAPELQITQEYTGQQYHLCFLATMWREFFDAAGVVQAPAIAGVANVGLDTNWTGHHFAAANWYAFGRMAWDAAAQPEQIAHDWLALTFTTDTAFVRSMTRLMVASREALVDYMMPLGLHHIFAENHHYGPQPWHDTAARPDWCCVYYHRADTAGIGFDRTRATGTAATEQYPEPLRSQYENLATCPEKYLLYFHHVPWTYRMHSGRTLWDELCRHYDSGVRQARSFQQTWDRMAPYVDSQRHAEVARALQRQAHDAAWWRDACVQYFQTFARMPIPYDLERPARPLDELRAIHLNMSHHN